MKKNKTIPVSVPLISLLLTAFCTMNSACNQQAQTNVSPAVMQQKDSSEKKFTASMVDNKKDPNCGMPVTAGIADTVHYKGKILGFCSDECKQAFLKNPDALVKNAELK
jgi:YHS domain-containing protein